MLCPFIKHTPFFSPITFKYLTKMKEGAIFFFLPITGFPITNQLTLLSKEIDKSLIRYFFFRKNYLIGIT